MSDANENLKQFVEEGLAEAEAKDELVLISSKSAASAISEKVKECVALSVLTPDEILGVINVLHYAIEDKRFFDAEMPTLCGYSEEGIKEIISKLHGSTNY